MTSDGRRPATYAQALQTTLRTTAAAYGYTLTTATTMGILTSVHGKPHTGQLFGFVAGGLVTFAILEDCSSSCRRSETTSPLRRSRSQGC